VIYYKGTATTDQRSAVLDSIAAVVSEWGIREPVPLPQITVEIMFEGDTACGKMFTGCAFFNAYLTQVRPWHPGYEWSCPALYHELAHLVYQAWGHADPRWKEWDRIGLEVSRKWARPDLPPP